MNNNKVKQKKKKIELIKCIYVKKKTKKNKKASRERQREVCLWPIYQFAFGRGVPWACGASWVVFRVASVHNVYTHSSDISPPPK